MTYVLSLRHRKCGGAVVWPQLVEGSIDSLRVAPRIALLVHGFNVNRDEGRAKLTGFAGLLKKTAEAQALVAVLWPGDSWAGGVSYPLEGVDADDTAAVLAGFISDVFTHKPVLSLVSHSLGARVVLGLAKRLLSRGFVIDQICVMAAAVDDDSLSALKVYRPAVEQANRVAVLYSGKDGVLRRLYPVGDLLQAFLYGRDSAGSALGLHGPKMGRRHREPIPGTVIGIDGPTRMGAGHGDYLPPEELSKINLTQEAAAAFVDAMLSGDPDPRYI